MSVRKLNKYLQNILSENIMKRLVGGSFLALGLSLLTAAIMFVSQVILARLLGVHDYGHFMHVMGWMYVLIAISTLGMNWTILKYGAAYRAEQDWAKLRGVMRHSSFQSIIGGVITAVLLLIGVLYFKKSLPPVLYHTFLFLIPLLPLRSLVQVQIFQYRAMQKISAAFLPDGAGRQLIFIAMCLSAYSVFGGHLSAPEAMAFFLISYCVTALFYEAFKIVSFPKEIRSVKAEKDLRLWFGMAAYFSLSIFVNAIMFRMDIAFVGALRSPSETGIYGAVSNIAGMLLVGYTALNTIFAPIFSELYQKNDHQKLWRSYNLSRLMQCGGSGFGFLILWFFGKQILALHGPEFVLGFEALMILGGFYLLNAFAGCSVQLANMTHMHKESAVISVLAIVLSAGLNLLLIPQYGINGAAFASGFSWSVMNFTLYFLIRAKLNELER